MHPNEIRTDTALVRRLVDGRFPEWAGLPVRPVDSYGTDHAIYRLGDHLAVRLPRVRGATGQAAIEARWLPVLAPRLPLALPVQVATGEPAEGYPFSWSVYEWLPGESADVAIGDLHQAAADLAAFVTALHRIDPAGAPPRSSGSRGGPFTRTSRYADRSPSSATGSTARPCCTPGRSRSMLHCGPTSTCGCTAICCPATCSSSPGDCRR